jgi:hypothetical protein
MEKPLQRARAALIAEISASGTSNLGTSDAPLGLVINHTVVSLPLVQNIRQVNPTMIFDNDCVVRNNPEKSGRALIEQAVATKA